MVKQIEIRDLEEYRWVTDPAHSVPDDAMMTAKDITEAKIRLESGDDGSGSGESLPWAEDIMRFLARFGLASGVPASRSKKKTTPAGDDNVSQEDGQEPSAGVSGDAFPWKKTLVEVTQFMISLLLAYVVLTALVQSMAVQSGSMIPTLGVGERFFVFKQAYAFDLVSPARGDVIVFKSPVDNSLFVKRIVGEPGDDLVIKHDGIYLNGSRLVEPYLPTPAPIYAPMQVTVPAGHYFVLGDNRDMSADSRVWGAIPEDSIIGKAAVVYWPILDARRMVHQSGHLVASE